MEVARLNYNANAILLRMNRTKIIALLIVAILTALAITGLAFQQTRTVSQIILSICLFTAVALSVGAKRDQGGSYKKYAQTNDLNYANIGSFSAVPPLLARAAKYSAIEMIWGNYRGHTVNLSIVNIYFGNEKRPIVYHIGQVSTKITGAKFFVASHNSSFLDEMGRIAPNLSHWVNGQTLQLEGNWNRYFNVIAPQGLQEEALQILTPDAMAAMIDFGKSFNFEAADGNIFSYHKDRIKPGPELDNWLELLTKIS